MATLPAERFFWVPAVTVPKHTGPTSAYLNHWWIVNDAGEIALYGMPGERWRSPQCNTHREIVERFIENVPGAAGVRLIPVVFLSHNCGDYL